MPTPSPLPSQEKFKLLRKPKKLNSKKAKIAIVIDDIGNTMEYQDLFLKLGDKITYAILPKLPHSTHFSRLSRKTGAEVILHLPLESLKGNIPGPGLITTNMPESHVLDLLSRNLASVPDHVGINNHMGSKGTMDSTLMKTLLRESKQRNLFFLDSQTTSQSVITSIANQMDLPVIQRDVFLDNIDEQAAIIDQLVLLSSVARQRGYAVGIGHYRFNTLKILFEEIPKMQKAGFEIVNLTDLIYMLSSENLSTS